MKTKLLALALLAGGSMFAQTRFSISIGSGGYNRGYYAQAPYAAVRPPCPGPDYSWTDGYYSGPNSWVPGYWSRQRYNGYGYQEQYQNRGYDYRQNREHRRYDHDHSFGRDRDDDDHDRSHGYSQDYRNNYGSSFRNR